MSSNFQIYLGKTDDRTPDLKVSNGHNSFTLYTALHAIQLFVLSFGVELLDRSVIHLLLQKYLSIYSCCCASDCILLLLLLCITQQQQQQQQAQLQQQEKINIKGLW